VNRRSRITRTTHRRPPPRKDKSSWWKRPLVWLGSIVGALIIAISTAFGTGIGQRLYSAAFSHSPSGSLNSPTASSGSSEGPIAIESLAYFPDASLGFTDAFPYQVSGEQLAALESNRTSDADVYRNDLFRLGGVAVGQIGLQVVISGNDSQTVTITDIKVLQRCTAPLTGTLLVSPLTIAPSLAPVTGISFNLDERFPEAQNYVNGSTSGSFFADKTIALNQGETQTLLLIAETYYRYCQFTFKLVIATSSGSTTELITNDGKSFEVTAKAKLEHYKALYVGDNRVDAKTIAQEFG
jgi:hypothetical protein